MEELIRNLVFIALCFVCCVATLTVMRALFPARIQRVRVAAEGAPRRAFLIGLINILFFAALALAAFAIGDRLQGAQGGGLFGMIGLALGLVVLTALTVGLSALAHLIGERLAPEGSPTRQSIVGAAALTLACLTPFAGWFVVLPLTAAMGVGAYVMTLLKVRRAV